MPLLPAHRSVRLATAAGAVVAIGSFGTAVAVAETSTPSPAPSSSNAQTPAPPAPGHDGPRGDRGHGGPGHADIVTAVGNHNLTVRTLAGTTKTYVVTSATKIHRGPGTALQLGDLRVGDRVNVRPTTEGGSTAADIDQHLAHLDGIVTAVDGDTVTITDRDGFTRVLHLQDATTYTSSGTSAARSAVTVGKQVRAEGRVASDRTSLDASRVDVSTPGERPAGPPPAAGGSGPAGRGPAGGPAAKAGHGASPAPSSVPSAAPGAVPTTPADGGVGGS